MSEDQNSPTLVDVLRAAMDAAVSNLHTSIPAEVVSYDETVQKVSVQPMIRRAYEDESGTRQVENLPIVNDVPVIMPGAGGYRITFPIAVGDTVALFFCQASIDKWLKQGGLVDPLDDRKHTLNDAFAVPGLKPFSSALNDAPTDRMSVGYDGGATIEIDTSEIRLGSNSASELLALKSDVQAIVDLLTGAGTPPDKWVVVATDGGGALQTAANSALSGIPAGTTKVKAE